MQNDVYSGFPYFYDNSWCIFSTCRCYYVTMDILICKLLCHSQGQLHYVSFLFDWKVTFYEIFQYIGYLGYCLSLAVPWKVLTEMHLSVQLPSLECNILYLKLEFVHLNLTKTICDGAYKNILLCSNALWENWKPPWGWKHSNRSPELVKFWTTGFFVQLSCS